MTIERALAISGSLLIATMLYEAPLFEVHFGSARGSSILVHSWDIAWVLVALVALYALFAYRAELGRSVRQYRRYWRDPIVAVAVLAIYATVSLSWTYGTFGSNGLSASVIQCLRLVTVVVLAVLIRFVAGPRVRNTLVCVFLGVSFVAALWAFIAWQTETTVVQSGTHALRLEVTRGGGPFGNWFASGTSDEWWSAPGASNVLGFWLAVALPVALINGRAMWLRSRLAGSAILMLLPVYVAGLLATHSRESWFACVIACVVLLWPTLRRLAKYQRVAAVLLLIMTVALVVALVPSVGSRVQESFTSGSFDYQSGPQARLASWRLGLRWAEERFPIGWGVLAIEEHPAHFGGHTTAENVYIQYFAQLGVVGLLALVAMSIEGLRLGLRAFSRDVRNLTGSFAPAFFAALIVHGMFGNTLGDPTIQILWGCALALCVGLTKTNEPPKVPVSRDVAAVAATV